MTIRLGMMWGVAIVALGGCGRPEPVADRRTADGRVGEVRATTTPPTPAPAPREPAVPVATPSAAVAGPSSVFTSIDPAKCDLITRIVEEAGYSRHRCFGVAGYRVELVESDLRQNLELIRPDGSSSSLDLPSLVAGGGFSTLGKTAEWRGTDPRRPRTLTVRYGVNENPDPAVAPRSYLVVLRLAAPACVVARVAAGPRQSEEAQEIADAARLPRCLGR